MLLQSVFKCLDHASIEIQDISIRPELRVLNAVRIQVQTSSGITIYQDTGKSCGHTVSQQIVQRSFILASFPDRIGI